MLPRFHPSLNVALIVLSMRSACLGSPRALVLCSCNTNSCSHFTGEPFGPVLLFFANHSSAHRLALDLAVGTGRLFARVHGLLPLLSAPSWRGAASDTLRERSTAASDSQRTDADSVVRRIRRHRRGAADDAPPSPAAEPRVALPVRRARGAAARGPQGALRARVRRRVGTQSSRGGSLMTAMLPSY